MQYSLENNKITLVIYSDDVWKLERLIPASLKTTNGRYLFIMYFPDQLGDSTSWMQNRKDPEIRYNYEANSVILFLCRNRMKHQIFFTDQKINIPPYIPLNENEIVIRKESECNAEITHN